MFLKGWCGMQGVEGWRAGGSECRGFQRTQITSKESDARQNTTQHKAGRHSVQKQEATIKSVSGAELMEKTLPWPS